MLVQSDDTLLSVSKNISAITASVPSYSRLTEIMGRARPAEVSSETGRGPTKGNVSRQVNEGAQRPGACAAPKRYKITR